MYRTFDSLHANCQLTDEIHFGEILQSPKQNLMSLMIATTLYIVQHKDRDRNEEMSVYENNINCNGRFEMTGGLVMSRFLTYLIKHSKWMRTGIYKFIKIN